MQDCHTPTFLQPIEFKFNATPTISDISRLHNLVIDGKNSRCFTPTVQGYPSPGLSPICDLTFEGNFQKLFTAASTQEHFKSPDGRSPFVIQQHQTPNATFDLLEVVRGGGGGEMFDAASPIFNIARSGGGNKSMSASAAATASVSPSLSLSFLNHTLNMTRLLRSIGLEEYTEMFAEQCSDMDAFMNIQPSDLPHMGIHSNEHCKRITKLLSELNMSASA